MHFTKTIMEFIPTSRGGQNLAYEGFVYSLKYKKKTTQRWECRLRRSKNCTGALVTNGEGTEVKSTMPHTHDPDNFTCQVMKVRSEIKKYVSESRGSTGQVITDRLTSYPTEVMVAAGSMETLKRTARRQKRGNTPGEPASLATVPTPLPAPYDRNLVYDNESESNRILVFATAEGLSLLAESATWFMDGTHTTAPAMFSQLFIIRAELSDSFQSTVYALLPTKEQECYEECLTAVLDACLRRNLRPNPTTVTVDYELAIHNAIRSVISSSIHIQGCFYHLTQSTWRRIQSEGLSPLYMADEEVRLYCGMLDGLAFLPVDRVVEGMNFIRQTAPDSIACIVDYFDTNYVNGGFRTILSASGSVMFRRTSPRFPPETWNVHDVTMSGQSRTNNACEGWNSGFGKLVGHAHPSLWTAIDCISKDAKMVQADVERNKLGEPIGRKQGRSVISHQRNLKNLCTHLLTGRKSVPEFVRAVGENIRLSKR